MRTFPSALYGSLGLLALSLALPVRAADPITLVHTYKEKNAFRYKTTIKIPFQGNEIVSVQTRKDTVKSVKDDGAVMLSILMESVTVDMGNGPMDQPTGAHPVTLILDKSGKLTDFTMDPTDESPFTPAIVKLVFLIDHVALPDKPVKADDVWQTELDDPAVKGKKVTIKSTFKGIEKKDGVALWKVVQTLEAVAADDGSKLTSEATIYLDPADGHEVYEEDTVKGVPSRYGPLEWKSKTELLKKIDVDKVAVDGAKPDAAKADADKKPDKAADDKKADGDKKPNP